MYNNILLSVYANTYIEPVNRGFLPQKIYNLIQKIPRYSLFKVMLYFFCFKILIVYFSITLDLGYEIIYQTKSDYPIITLMILKLIGIFYGFILLPIIFIYSSVSILFCYYQKYSKNEDFKEFKDAFISSLLIFVIAFNFHNILSYYLWKRKFKNTECYIENRTFYLKATTNHSMIENSEIILHNPVTQGVLKGKIFLSEGILIFL